MKTEYLETAALLIIFGIISALLVMGILYLIGFPTGQEVMKLR